MEGIAHLHLELSEDLPCQRKVPRIVLLTLTHIQQHNTSTTRESFLPARIQDIQYIEDLILKAANADEQTAVLLHEVTQQ